MINSRTGKSKIIAYALAMTPLLFSYYAFVEQVLISDLVIISTGGILLVSGYHSLPRTTLSSIYGFALWIIVISLYHQFNAQQSFDLPSLFIPARMLFYYILAVPLGLYYLHSDTLQRSVITLSVLFAIYSLVQLAVYSSTGVTLVTGIPFLPQRYGLEIINNHAEIFSLYGYRPSAFFTEPAHLAQYCAIGALLLLQAHHLNDKNAGPRFVIVKLLLLLVAPLLAGSTTSVFTLVFIVLAIILQVVSSAFIKVTLSSKHLLLYLLVIVVAVSSLVWKSQAISRLIAGVSTGFLTLDTSALFVRVLRPFDYISILLQRGELSGLAFGYGYGAYEQVLQSANLVTAYEIYSQVYWVNTFGLTISAVGVVGFFFLSLIFVALFRHTNKVARMLIVYLYASLFFSDMAASSFAVLVIALALSMRKNELKLLHSRFMEIRA